MKKPFIVFLIMLLAIFPLAACERNSFYTSGDGELKIVTTVFVPFDIAREVTDGRASITLLQSNGADLHDYSPTASALTELNEADIFICVGGVTDETWVDDAVAASENANLTVIKLTELCQGLLAELEGHSHNEYCEQAHGHSHGHEHEHVHTANDGHGHVSDEHVWTSVRNVVSLTSAVADACAEKDGANAEFYKENAERYKEKLSELDARYKQVAQASHNKTAVFADRFPFIYLTSDYGLCHYAAFSGCSSETDASFATAVKLISAVRDNSLDCVFVTENTDGKLASSVSDATGCKILELNSLQSVTAKQIDGGLTYLGAMEQNLSQLQKGLS